MGSEMDNVSVERVISICIWHGVESEYRQTMPELFEDQMVVTFASL